MTKSILTAVRDTLVADSILTALLGGNYIFMAEIMQAAQFPSITLRLTSESSKNRVGYTTYKKRDNYATIQCDIWSKKSRQETYEIADVLEENLMSWSVSGTRCWSKTSDGDMYEDDTKIYHKPMRYSFEYIVTDAAYFQLGYDMLGYGKLG
jgi:hypothetical protein